MYLIFDLAMLKHHRVDYGEQVKFKPARPQSQPRHKWTVVAIALVAVSVVVTHAI